MANSEIKKLATSLRENIETLHPITTECCIYRIPQSIRILSESAFTPKVVSIGPLHHGKPELKVMEEHKRRYLLHFLQRTQVTIEDFLTFIKYKEVSLRNCYAEKIDLKSDEFVTMILVDAIFLIECFLRFSNNDLISNDDCIFRRPWIDVRSDIWLLENQLPLFILNDLFILSKTSESYDLIKLIKVWFKLFIVLERPENVIETHFSKAEHLLDLRRLSVQPPLWRSKNMVGFEIMPVPQNIPTIMELHQVGVKFMLGSQNNLLDIKFNSGFMEIPLLVIYPTTEVLFRNLLALERLHCSSHYINDYILLLSHLVSTARDVELLVQNGVIKSWLMDSEAVSTLLHNLGKQTTLYSNTFQYCDLVDELKAHCNFPWHKWNAILKQNYFNTPWASISVSAAAILLLLTVIQAVCSIIAL